MERGVEGYAVCIALFKILGCAQCTKCIVKGQKNKKLDFKNKFEVLSNISYSVVRNN